MGFRVELLHDVVALLVCLAIGVAASFAHPLATSLGVFALCYALWLVLTSPLAGAKQRASLDPRVTRASLGGVLLLTSAALIAVSEGLEPRLTVLVLIAISLAVVLYVHRLSRG